MRLPLFSLVLVAMVAGAPVLAGDKGHDGKQGGHGKGRQRAFCPHCGEACYPTVAKGTETEHCWNVETKAICIPKVRFPWESDCGKAGGKNACPAPKCGRTKYVNVLMKHEYECSTCKYSWDVDSYKYGNGKKDKTAPVGEPTEADPHVADPPPVEASLPSSNRRRVVLDTKSYAEILTSFFK